MGSATPPTTPHPLSPEPAALPSSDPIISNTSPGLLEILRQRDHRQKKPSILLKNFVTHAVAKEEDNPSRAPSYSDQSSPNTVPGKTQYPIANYSPVSVFSKQHQAFLATITK